MANIGNAELFFFQPDRSGYYPIIESGPLDSTGKGVRLRDYFQVESGEALYFLCEDDSPIVPDFLYEIGLNLIVSDRSLRTFSQLSIPRIRVYPVELVNRKWRTLASMNLLKFCGSFEILDIEGSDLDISSSGIVRVIRKFVVDYSAVPDHDVFVCSKTRGRIFSRSAVRTIRGVGLTGAEFIPLCELSWP